MVNYTNRDYITSLSATDTTSGIKDGTDHIHSGLIKYLEQAARGNYVVSYSSANFQQVAGSSRTQFQFSGAIKFVRDGRIYSATPAAEELKSDPDGTNDRYDMLVINSSNALEFREGTAGSTPRVPDNLSSGDIPVALVKVEGGTGANVTTREVQLYGYNKTTYSTTIDKIYNTTAGEVVNINGTDISLWGSSAIGAFTLERSEAGKEILTVKNTGSEKGAVIEGTGGTATNKVLEVKYDGATKAGITGQGNIELQGLTASRALISNSSKVIEASATTSTELGYVSGVTGAIQSQIDGKCTLTGSTNNQVTTVTGAHAITGEAQLTFDGTHLTTPSIKSTVYFGNASPELVLAGHLGPTPMALAAHMAIIFEDANAGTQVELPDPNAAPNIITRIVNLSSRAQTITVAGGILIYQTMVGAPNLVLPAGIGVTLMAFTDSLTIPADGAQAPIVGPCWIN